MSMKYEYGGVMLILLLFNGMLFFVFELKETQMI